MKCYSPWVFQEVAMTPKNVSVVLVCAMLLAWSGRSFADEYRSGEFLKLDLSSAVLSPKPLGPSAEFVPAPPDANVARESEGAQASAEPKPEPRIVVHKTRIAHLRMEKPRSVRMEKPRSAARTQLARRHTNPLDAQAFDTRIQVWPCRSGGICGWKR
jgi:hypothetical protein